MKSFFIIITQTHFSGTQHFVLMLFRISVALELFIVHGLKKIGVGVSVTEVIPNPFAIPDSINQFLAISANTVLPFFIVFGFLTRLAILPILGITLTGYFVVHADDSLIIKDIPFMYSIFFLFLFFTGPGDYSIDARIHKSLSK